MTEIKDTPTLCLNMIVKNESKIITRLFDSVISIIDCYCICDTGSTDNTPKIIDDYFSNKKIPGKILYKSFKSFSYNRNFALQSSLGMSDYVLFLDADMMLKINNFHKEDLLCSDAHYILQGNDEFYYQNVRIVKNNGLYSYECPTHEYINVPNGIKINNIVKENLFILDIGDGGAKSDKCERDIKLLSDGLLEQPNNVRYHFYLANTYFDKGDYEKAIKHYKKRIDLGGWNQEVWYSYYRIGSCHKNMGNIAEAIITWMNGYDYFPDRLEGLYEIINHYRYSSKHKLCYVFYKLAQEVLNKKKNIDDYLFLHKDIYSFKLHYEYTVVAAYLGIKNINDETVTILNNSKDDVINQNLFNNMKFYKDFLIPNHVVIMDSKKTIMINNENIDFHSSSSCLIPNFDDTGYFLNVRYVNYHITPDGSYINCDKHIISVNQVVKLDKDMNLISSQMFDNDFNDRLYIGIEDLRMFKEKDTTNEKLIFTGTGFHENNKIGIVYGEYDIHKDSLLSNEITSSFSKSECEKNWVYVTYENKTHVIYKWYPLQICKINENANKIDLVKIIEMPRIFSHVRGSSCGFTYKNEIWFVVHNVSYESPRHYYHMIIVFDENMKLLRYSSPFKFEGEPIEYCLSIVVEDERVIINYSTWDRTSRIGIYDKKYIDSITKY